MCHKIVKSIEKLASKFWSIESLTAEGTLVVKGVGIFEKHIMYGAAALGWGNTHPGVLSGISDIEDDMDKLQAVIKSMVAFFDQLERFKLK